ncbi:MAG: glycosyltransferase [Planctomycetota bacterium]
MRILLLTPFLPDPAASHGGGAYLGNLATALSQEADVGLVAIVRRQEHDTLDRRDVQWRWHATLPYRERPPSGGLPHQMRMLWHWRRLPLVAAKHWQPEMARVLTRARTEFRPDVVLVELAQMAQYLPLLRDVPTILTDHEGGCPANSSTGLGAWGDRRDAELWARYVDQYYPLASLVQAVTREDAEGLARRLGREVLVRPPTCAVPSTAVAPDRAPARVLFLGDYRHHPNPEAATTLAHEVLPLLRAVDPTTELWLAGPNEERVRSLGNKAGVRVLGYVPDLRELFGQVRLLLAPLWSGSGFRMKVLAALAHGLPVVTNTLGGRGCEAPAPARQIAEGPRALADAALSLLRSPANAAEAGRVAFAWARANLPGAAVARVQLERAAALLSSANPL